MAKKRFQVLIREINYGTLTVMADDAEEAEALAYEAAEGESTDIEDLSWEIAPEYQVDEVTEVEE